MLIRDQAALQNLVMGIIGFVVLSHWAKLDQPCLAQESFLVASFQAQQAEQRILTALQQPVSFDYREKPLKEIIEELGKSLSINTYMDSKVISDSGLDINMPITFRARNLTARTALSRMLSDQGLTWTVVEETLKITTKETDGGLMMRVYLVRDLVATSAIDPGSDNADPLINLLTGTVATDTWSELGGPGTVDYFSNAGALVVSQSRAVHDDIENLLVMLRKARGLQGIRPVVEASRESSNADFVLAKPRARIYSARQAWNVPQMHQ